jgi:hypothetical protein
MDIDEVNRLRVSMLVDTSSYMMCINESIQEQLPVLDSKKAQMGENSIINCHVLDHLQMRFKNRHRSGHALVLPRESEPLLGTYQYKNKSLM